MSVIAAALKHMLAANMPHEAILEAVADMERGLQTDEQAERRRAADRDRQRERRLRISAESADKPDSPRVGVTPGSEKPLTTEIEPQKKQEKSASKATRLPLGWVLPDDFRQDAIEIGLPPERIDIEAATMVDWSRSSPTGAKREWRSVWRNWCRRAIASQPRYGPKAPARGIGSVFEDMHGFLSNGQDSGDPSDEPPQEAVLGISYRSSH